ncbi:hypothetical protein BCONGLO52_09930 [Brachybacterium conglomeratum]|uniref:Uncharacterized protein n=1 Tax=Brachybacterium conglomeratum TaxID=47846 RepID=A0ABQ5REV2_9MICO|nr:hypothetical protein BCONGLO52_09930 [Brachybacterium conglomeratum]GLK04690.1 hypothetical protein GCM10017597_14900 [Brachybacterium conglomeratum]
MTPVSRIRRPPVPPGVDGAAAGEVCDMGSSGDGGGGAGLTREASGRARAGLRARRARGVTARRLLRAGQGGASVS